MAAVHRIYLIPGFFGFAHFGDLKYFAHVRDHLGARLAGAGLDAEIHYVRTLPTASLRRRAARLVDAIAETDDGRGDLHLIGHSTGGIDARLLTSPGVSLPSKQPVEPIAARVRSVVTIASPHHGTPQSTTFTSVVGQHLLRALSMLTLHGVRLGSVPLPALVALAGALPRVSGGRGPLISILDQVYRQLLKGFDHDRRVDLESFFAAAGDDPALLSQLSPHGMDLFNAATSTRASTRYASVVACSRPPGWRGAVALGLSPTAQATYAVYRGLYELAAKLPSGATPLPTPDQRAALTTHLGSIPGAAANDAIVPARSQIFGEVIHAVWADHLDVIGHFADPDRDPPHVDWLMTRSGFDRPAFERLWNAVAAYVAADLPVGAPAAPS